MILCHFFQDSRRCCEEDGSWHAENESQRLVRKTGEDIFLNQNTNLPKSHIEKGSR